MLVGTGVHGSPLKVIVDASPNANLIGAAPVCAGFSRAVTPAWRSKDYPYGKPNLAEAAETKVAGGNRMANSVSNVGETCVRIQLPFWI